MLEFEVKEIASKMDLSDFNKMIEYCLHGCSVAQLERIKDKLIEMYGI